MMSFYCLQSWCRCKQTSPVFLSDLSVKSDRFSFERSACGQVQTDDLDSWCESQNSRRSWRVSHDGPLKEIVHVKNENNVVIYERRIYVCKCMHQVRLLDRFGPSSSCKLQESSCLLHLKHSKKKKVQKLSLGLYLFKR